MIGVTVSLQMNLGIFVFVIFIKSLDHEFIFPFIQQFSDFFQQCFQFPVTGLTCVLLNVFYVFQHCCKWNFKIYCQYAKIQLNFIITLYPAALLISLIISARYLQIFKVFLCKQLAANYLLFVFLVYCNGQNLQIALKRSGESVYPHPVLSIST